MLSMVVAAMFSKASCVKKAWWPVMITFGKVSSRANTSSLRISPRAIFEEDLFFLLVHIEAEVTDLAARRQLIIRRTLIPSSVKLLGESPYRPVAAVTECPSLGRACAIAWVAVAAPQPA